MDIVIKEEVEDHIEEYDSKLLEAEYEKNLERLEPSFEPVSIKKENEGSTIENENFIFKVPQMNVRSCTVVITKEDREAVSIFFRNDGKFNVGSHRILEKKYSPTKGKDRRKNTAPKKLVNKMEETPNIFQKAPRIGCTKDKMNLVCKKCSYRAESQSALREHVNSVHMFMIVKKGSSIYSHNFNEKKIKNKYVKHHNDTSSVKIKKVYSKPVKCPKANNLSPNKKLKKSKSKSSIKEKDRISVKKSTKKSKVYKKKSKFTKSSPKSRKNIKSHLCPSCPKKFLQLRALNKHVNCVHLKIKAHKCDYCDFACVYVDTFRTHINRCHPMEVEYSKNTIDEPPISRLRPKKEIKPSQGDLKELLGELSESEYDHNDVDCNLEIKEELKKNECDVCGYCFRTNNKLKQHIDQVHFKIANYKCDLCDFSSVYRRQLMVHRLKVHNDETACSPSICDYIRIIKFTNKFGHFPYDGFLNCDCCDYRCRGKNAIKCHILEKHFPELALRCEHCDFVAVRKSRMEHHTLIKHTTERPFLCDYEACTFTCKTKGHLRIHVDTVHHKIATVQCELCDLKFYSKFRLRCHVGNIHLKLKSYSCTECEYKTNHRSLFRSHMEIVHLNLRKFQCPNCDYFASTKSCLNTHVNAIHLKAKPFECNQCSHQATTKGNLKKHIDTVHLNKKPFACDLCTYRTSLRSALKLHTGSVHGSSKTFKCDYETTCNFSTNMKQRLKQHVDAVHLDRNPFKCKNCTYSTLTKGKLKAHIDTVHVEDTFNCDDCEYESSSITSLKTHIDTEHSQGEKKPCKFCEFEGATVQALKLHSESAHADSKPFKCCLCEYGTTSKGNLKVHVDSVHLKVKRFRCIECDYGSYLKSGLKIHINGVHHDKNFNEVLEESLENSKKLMNDSHNNSNLILKTDESMHEYTDDSIDQLGLMLPTSLEYYNGGHDSVVESDCSQLQPINLNEDPQSLLEDILHKGQSLNSVLQNSFSPHGTLQKIINDQSVLRNSSNNHNSLQNPIIDHSAHQNNINDQSEPNQALDFPLHNQSYMLPIHSEDENTMVQNNSVANTGILDSVPPVLLCNTSASLSSISS